MEIGAGALTLLGSNYSYTGSTIVSGGVLQVGNGTIGAALAGTTNVQLTANGANYGGLVFDLPGNATYGGAIGGVGNVTQAGSGLLTLTGSNLSSGQTTVSAGSLQLGVGGATGTITGSLYVGNGTFLLDRSGTMSNGIAGSGPLVKIGSDSVTLNGNLSGFSGPINVAQGQLVLASPAPTSAPITSVYTASSGGTLQFFGASYNLGTRECHGSCPGRRVGSVQRHDGQPGHFRGHDHRFQQRADPVQQHDGFRQRARLCQRLPRRNDSVPECLDLWRRAVQQWRRRLPDPGGLVRHDLQRRHH